ncbi:MAG: EamA family transporter [Flavobacteriales bacterium]|nr:EamA family transporter [Flavobacteriales bacterium]
MQTTTLRSWLLLLLIGFIWGSSFILMKKGLLLFAPNEVAALRMSLAWLVTMPFLVPRFREIKPQEWLVLLSVGLLGNGIPAILFATAQKTMDSAPVGMLNSLVPIFTLVFGVLLFKVKTWTRQVIGLLVGLVGALILIIGPEGIGGLRWEAVLVVIASACYAFNLNMIKRFLPKMPSTLITSAAFLWIGPMCLVYLSFTDFFGKMDAELFPVSFSAITVLSVVGTSFAVLLFNTLIQTGGPLFASMVTYVVPVFAVMWGVIDGENIHFYQLFGVLIILLGVYLVQKPVK